MHTSSKEVLKPKYTDHNGYLMPHGFPTENFASSLHYEPDQNDLFICTYPKCGTTLTQNMVYLLLNDGNPILKDERLDKIFPHLEEVGAEFVKESAAQKSNYRLIKTHMPFKMVKYNSDAKYIVVARNPKDCVVSFYHHTRGFPKHYDFADGDFNVYFDLFKEGKVDFGCYYEMTKSWFDQSHHPNVLFLTYERIVSNKKQVIKEIANFLSHDLASKLEENDSALMEKILLHSSVESMKKDPLRWCSERDGKFTPFIRKGKSGDWLSLLTDAQAEILDKKTREYFNQEEVKELGDKY